MRSFQTVNPARLIAATLSIAASAFVAQPAHAETLTFTCGFTQDRIDLMNKAASMGTYLGDVNTRFDFRIDTTARTAVALDFPDTAYPATIAASEISWSLPRDEDDPCAATFSLNRATNVLTSVDPDGDKTLWNCTAK